MLIRIVIQNVTDQMGYSVEYFISLSGKNVQRR